MKYLVLLIMTAVIVISAESLFQVKDSSGNAVLDVSDNGMTILNANDTLMTITSDQIKAFIDQNASKGLSRSFSVTSVSSRKSQNNVFSVNNDATTIWEGTGGNRYTGFSPLNIFIGLNSGLNNQPNPNSFDPGNQTTWEGKFNIFIGNESGRDNVNGYFNLFVGDKAGQLNNGGQKNTFVGSQSGQSNVSGGYNSHFGYNSGITSTGNQNTFVGANCGFYNAEKNYNTYIGTAAGEYFKGSYNTFLGSSAGRNASTVRTGDGNVFIGYSAGSSSGSISNKLYIDNSNTETPLIYGDFANDYLTVNGRLNVGTLPIEDLGATTLGLHGDIVPHSSVLYDLGNNTATEHWDDVVAQDFIAYTAKNIKAGKAMESSLDKLMKVKPVSYKAERDKYGFIPDELEEIIPQAVVSQDIDIDPETGQTILKRTDKGIVYDQLIPVLIRSVQEQQKMIEELKAEIADLKKNQEDR